MKNSEREDKEYEGKKEFRECMKEAIKSSLSYLKRKSEREQIIPFLEYDFEIDVNKRSWNTVPKSRYPLASFVKKNLEEILKLAEVTLLIDFMVKNEFHKMIEMEITDKNGKIKDVERIKKFLGYNILGGFLMRYVETVGGFNYDENTFNDLYRELEEYIYTEGREIIVVAPLLNFELKGIEKIDLGDFIIRKISEDEFKMLLSQNALGEIHSLYPYGGIFETIWCIELKVKCPSKRRSEDLTPYIEKVITTLRLFKKGSIHYSAILDYPKVWKNHWGVSSHGGGEIYGPRYELTDKDIESLKAFWNKFKSLNTQNYPFLDVAIRRFNFSYERRLPEDKLIDYITAFEALYLKGVEKELSYRLALRCACFLGKDGEERRKIFEILKSAYDARSKIVHGEPIESKSFKKLLNKLNLNLPELSMQVEEYLRESIKTFLHFLQKSESHDEIIKEIDEKIITGFG